MSEIADHPRLQQRRADVAESHARQKICSALTELVGAMAALFEHIDAEKALRLRDIQALIPDLAARPNVSCQELRFLSEQVMARAPEALARFQALHPNVSSPTLAE
jgi:hypothetical protein